MVVGCAERMEDTQSAGVRVNYDSNGNLHCRMAAANKSLGLGGKWQASPSTRTAVGIRSASSPSRWKESDAYFTFEIVSRRCMNHTLDTTVYRRNGQRPFCAMLCFLIGTSDISVRW